MSWLEIAANAFTVICIFLAGRNNVHTWWTGIVACVLFGALFVQSQLYADATLQVFFIVTSIIGWIHWTKTDGSSHDSTITTVSSRKLLNMSIVAVLVAGAYGMMLHKFTDAYAPAIDSLVLTFSVVGQLLLMKRNLQSWYVWIFVNILSVPLYFSRELYLTGGLYTIFLFHAIYAAFHWNKLYKAQAAKV